MPVNIIGIITKYGWKAASWAIHQESIHQVRLWHRNRILKGPWLPFHMSIAHAWRQLCVLHPCTPGNDLEAVAKDLLPDLNKIAIGCRDVMSEMFRVPYGRIHCTIKGVAPGKDGIPLVYTLGRSDENESRLAIEGPSRGHELRKNTVFASIVGEDDGGQHWPAHSFFACNDLAAAAGKFRCTRQHWQGQYNSAFVVPLRWKTPDADRYNHVGFLTFDSPAAKGFVGLPDIFRYDAADYKLAGAKNAAFHVAGVMADTLTVLLRPFLEGDAGNDNGDTEQRCGSVTRAEAR